MIDRCLSALATGYVTVRHRISRRFGKQDASSLHLFVASLRAVRTPANSMRCHPMHQSLDTNSDGRLFARAQHLASASKLTAIHVFKPQLGGGRSCGVIDAR